jgi:hypothetical protein
MSEKCTLTLLLIEHTDVPVYLEDIKGWDAPAPAG